MYESLNQERPTLTMPAYLGYLLSNAPVSTFKRSVSSRSDCVERQRPGRRLTSDDADLSCQVRNLVDAKRGLWGPMLHWQ